MTAIYADALVYATHVDVLQQRQVIESIPLAQEPQETWHHFILSRVTPAVRSLGWSFNDWHRPRQIDTPVLASTFLWKDI